MTAYSEEEKYWIVAASTGDISPRLFYYILNTMGSMSAFFDAVRTDSAALAGLPEKALRAARAACSDAYISEAVSRLVSGGIVALTRLSSGYPAQLADIEYPPPVLFVKGHLDLPGDRISIVGTRRCTRRGFEAARRIAKDISAHMTVISGMANGIDTAAHRGAMDAGAPTVAVLGCGVDVIYPPDNAEIYHYAVSHGAVVSELPPGAQPSPQHFPARNRIVTGLSRGTLIVESEIKGGTAISAAAAIAQRRDVFAVPGAAGAPMSVLPNTLIQQGAAAVTQAADIMQFYGMTGDLFMESDSANTEIRQLQLDFLQKQIYNLLQKGDMGSEEIAGSIECPQSEINAALTMMELFGIICRQPGAKYGLKN